MFLEVCFETVAKKDTTVLHFRTNDGLVNEEQGGRVRSPSSTGDCPESVDSLNDLQKCSSDEIQWEK